MDASPLTVVTVGGLAACAFAVFTGLLVRREERRRLAPAGPATPADRSVYARIPAPRPVAHAALPPTPAVETPPAPAVETPPAPRAETLPDPRIEAAPEPAAEPEPSLVLSLDAYTRSGA